MEIQLGSFVVMDTRIPWFNAAMSQRPRREEVGWMGGSNKHKTFTKETAVRVLCETKPWSFPKPSQVASLPKPKMLARHFNR